MLSLQTDLHRGEQLSRLIAAEDIRLLAAIGFLASKSGCVAPAIRIFQALIKLRPQADYPYIGLSIAFMAVGMNSAAIEVLMERESPTNSESDSMDLWRSLAFHLAGNRSSAAASLKKYATTGSANTNQALIEKLTRELGLRASVPDWPSPAVVSDHEATF
jgi:hypothetical protein